MDSDSKCPFCAAPNIWSARQMDPGIILFDDVKVPFWKPFTDVGILMPAPCKVCMSCGHYWGTLDLDEAKRFVERHGSDGVKARIKTP